MSAQPIRSAEGHGLIYNLYKRGDPKVKTAAAMGTYIVQNFYDGDTGQGQRADLLSAIQVACALFHGDI